VAIGLAVHEVVVVGNGVVVHEVPPRQQPAGELGMIEVDTRVDNGNGEVRALAQFPGGRHADVGQIALIPGAAGISAGVEEAGIVRDDRRASTVIEVRALHPPIRSQLRRHIGWRLSFGRHQDIPCRAHRPNHVRPCRATAAFSAASDTPGLNRMMTVPGSAGACRSTAEDEDSSGPSGADALAGWRVAWDPTMNTATSRVHPPAAPDVHLPPSFLSVSRQARPST
jgi:hypothetical protein